MTEVVGKPLMRLMATTMGQWRSRPPLVFEPYAYETLKTANELAFGFEGLAAYRMEETDLLVSFGADFLETWLSPIEYARKFKEMHALKEGRKGLFFHIAPHQSLTGANADLWLSCLPASEAIVALGLLREALNRGMGQGLSADLRDALEAGTTAYPKERVLQISGIAPPSYDRLLARLFKARRPLFIGTVSGAPGLNALQTDMTANLLNLVFDPGLSCIDFKRHYRVAAASRRSEVSAFFEGLEQESVDVLLLNNVNPIFALPPGIEAKKALARDSLFVVSFSNFVDETSRQADLIIPTLLPLERWDEYGGLEQIVGTLQPAMRSLNEAPHIGDLLLGAAFDEGSRPAKDFRSYLYAQLVEEGLLANEFEWVAALRQGGLFKPEIAHGRPFRTTSPDRLKDTLDKLSEPPLSAPVLVAAPSLRFYDGRGANRPWLCEIPDPLSKVSWQTPVMAHGETLRNKGLRQGDLIEIESKWGVLEAPVYETAGVNPGALVMNIGQGHTDYGRYAAGQGLNPILLMAPDLEPISGAPRCSVDVVEIRKSGASMALAHTDGSRTQQGREIALSLDVQDLAREQPGSDHDMDGHGFPLTLPLPEGYHRSRDIYPPHDHDGYRWAMVVDLDRCIGCGACSAACYAENNIGVVGKERIIAGREMAWIQIQRYLDTAQPERITFLPMLCQHCDNAPCESVCPVFAPHHNKEGINNQIYNRCIGTRFCSQNCPYKVRRFNWFDWEWPKPMNLQLNPEVTARSKGVMEKCSFCIQRIKAAHGVAKDENREIRDGEIQPACLQTCPTGVFTFGNLMDHNSLVRRQVADRRAYQILGYLNTKPAVIYLKKIMQTI